ncbi:hypothetical protein L204_103638 [Cryptococcus depauperatus]|nr:hypothetical protein L204_01956 [Cryptococcus depauperatus CBS 7855]
MSLSLRKPNLSRQPSAPSLAVGLPPALPESNIMAPTSISPNKMPKTRSRNRIHRGDVESTESSDAEDVSKVAEVSKRKVINSDTALSSGNRGKKKETLAERMAAATAGNTKARVKNVSDVNGGLKSSGSTIAETSTAVSSSLFLQTPSPAQSRASNVSNTTTAPKSMSRASVVNTSDKVVVCVRVKPTKNPFASVAYETTSTSLSLSNNHPKVRQRGGKGGREDTYTYTFDKLLQYPSNTPELYSEKVAPMVEKAMIGFNSTVFAYGQTGSGKSFTMTGIPSELGIIPCAVDGVFDAINEDPDRAFLLRVSYIEIYNETLRDLLNFKRGPLKDDERPIIHTSKGKIYVDPLIEEIVSTPEDVMGLLERGNAQRRIGATDWNEQSSRSHCVFTIIIESKPRDSGSDEDIRLSRLNLIDLAGSEKAVSDSERRGEGKHINQSLLALREVINKLTEKNKASHIPYRNSKLTHLLENALGGDSNICVICTLSVEEEHCGETLETLKFAGRCSQVKTHAKKNILPSSERALIRAKDQEIEELKARLQNLQFSTKADSDDDQIVDLAESVAAMEARKTKLITQLAKLNSEILTSELPRHHSGSLLPISPPKPKRRRISDYSALVSNGDRIGLGMGTPKKTDRRAVSGLIRVQEDNQIPGITATLDAVGELPNFAHDIALASLKKNLAHKEEELVLANRNLATALARASRLSERDERIAILTLELSTALKNLSDLRGTLQSTESHLKKQNTQLEATRVDLEATVENKTCKIDELETKILELKRSREDMAIEDESRLQDMRKQLEQVFVGKKEAEKQLEQFEKEVEAWKKAEIEQKAAQNEVEELKNKLQILEQQHSDTKKVADKALSESAEYKVSISSLTTQINDLLLAQSSRDAALKELQAANVEAKRKRDQAVQELDSFQKEAMAHETKVLAELREEIGKSRKKREDDKTAWVKQRSEMQAKLEEFRENDCKIKAQLADALQALKDVAQNNKDIGDKLSQEADIRHSVEKVHDEALKRAKETAGATAAQLEREMASHQESEHQLAALRIQLNAQRISFENTKLELEVEKESAKKLSMKLQSVQADLKIQETRIKEVINERKEIELRLSEMQSALEESEKAQQLMVNTETTRRKGLEDKLRELEDVRQAEMSTEKDLQSRLCSESKEKNQLWQKVKALEDLQSAKAVEESDLLKKYQSEASLRREAEDKLLEFDDLRENEAKLLGRIKNEVALIQETEDKITDLVKRNNRHTMMEEDLKRQLEAEGIAREVAEKKAEELNSRLSMLSTAKGDLQRRLDDEISNKKCALMKTEELEKCLKSEVGALMEKLVAQTTARENAEKKLANANEQLNTQTSLNKEHREFLDQGLIARQEVDRRLSEVTEKYNRSSSAESHLQASLIEESVKSQEAESKITQLILSLEEEKARCESLEAKQTINGSATEELVALTAEHTALKDQITHQKSAADANAAAMAKTLQDKHNKEIIVLKDEIASLRELLARASSETQKAMAEAITYREKTTKLTQNVFELETCQREQLSTTIYVSTRRRTLSTPVPWKNAVIDATLDGKDTSPSKLNMKEPDEVKKLEKIVEMQKGIIEQQKMRIETSSKDMEKQREVMNLLASHSESNTYIPSPRRVSHTRAHSISHSPRDSPAITQPVKGLPATFAARNLALPTTPTPLPMHPSQFSNASARKGRRRTIEHDIDLLTESSKVNRAKAMFESPEKSTKLTPLAPSTPTREPLRINQAAWSIPRQRLS